MNRGGRPRAVYDCNIFLQAVLTPGGPGWRCVDLAARRHVILVLSPAVLAEVRGVLRRPLVRSHNPEVTAERIDGFLDRIRYTAEFVSDVPELLADLRDPDDAPYADLAVVAAADFLVSRDRDLLDLASAHDPAAKQFRQLTRNRTRVVDPVTFLNEFGGQA